MTRLTAAETAKALREHEVLSDTGAQPSTDARRELDRAMRETLSRLFLAHWRRNELPELTREYRFHPTRKWRFDFALPEQKMAIEVDGGTRQGGRHNRAEGYAKDAEKLNSATALGWTVFRFSDVMLKEGPDAMDGHLQVIREYLEC